MLEQKSGGTKSEIVLCLRLSRGLVATVALALALALGAVAATVGFAQSDETINGCVSKKKGTLRITNPPSTCTSKETAISWPADRDADTLDNLDSTAFLRSDGTAANADKLDGQDSSAFLTTTGKAADADKLDGQDSSALLPSAIYEVVLQDTTGLNLDPTGVTKQANAACDSGDNLLSGGISGIDEGTHLIASFPEKLANLWVVRWKNDDTADSIGVHALCADFPPAHT